MYKYAYLVSESGLFQCPEAKGNRKVIRDFQIPEPEWNLNTIYKLVPLSVLIFFNAWAAFISGWRHLYWLQGLTATWVSRFQWALWLTHFYAKDESHWLHNAWRNKVFLCGRPNKYNPVLSTVLIGQNSIGWLLSRTIFSL